jgi:hypothetical protein
MLAKELQLDEYFRGSNGLEPTVQVLDFDSKVASEASEWSRRIQPTPGKTYILVLAMGASEFYGPNRNGDAFKESELLKTHKTFETNAHVYKSHVNKDPAKSYGKIVKSFYNPDMHRVELILEIDNAKAPDIVEKVNSGRSVAVSMGCKIKYDVCTICGNKAPTRAQYCTHLRNELNKIYPDGRIVAADNPNPKFFDISIVWRPADKTGYMLKKVAYSEEDGPSSAWLAEKQAARVILAKYLNKAAEIEKLVSGVGFKPDSSGKDSSGKDSSLNKQWLKTVVPKLRNSFTEVTDEDKGYLSGFSIPKVLKSLSSMGIFLATPEFLDLVYIKLTGSKAPSGLAQNLVSLQGDIFSLLAKHPDMAEDLIYQGIAPSGSEEVDSDIQEKMSKYLPSRGWGDKDILKNALGYTKLASSNTQPVALARNKYSIPYVDKVASTSYAVYIASILEAEDNPSYTKLASLVSENSLGYRHWESKPWAALTLLSLNRQL